MAAHPREYPPVFALLRIVDDAFDDLGYYRITFSLDNGQDDPFHDSTLPDLNTCFDFAEIVVPMEEPTLPDGEDSGETGGGTPSICSGSWSETGSPFRPGPSTGKAADWKRFSAHK